MKTSEAYGRAVARYLLGAASAAILTIAIYVVVASGSVANHTVAAAIILVVAAVQFCLQIFFFLPVTSKRGPSWRLHSLWFVVLTLLIIVVGSLWIMKNLDYNMGMSPEQMREYMLKENQKGF